MTKADSHKPTAAALGRVPSGLFIVTVRRGEAETGLLASWVQQCSFEPLQVSMAVRRDRPVTAWLADGSAFHINILDASQTDMIAHFGRGFALDEPAFTGLEITRPDGGPPVLKEAVAYLKCRVTSHCAAGDHDLYVCEVIGGKVLSDGQPMVHVRKSGLHY